MSDHACPHCQYSPVPPGSRFCPNCGEEQPQESPKAQITVNQQIGTLQEGTATGVHIEHLVGSVNLTQVDENQARRRRNLLILLRKVRDFWISGVLERSVQGSALISLVKQLLPSAVAQPWAGVAPPATDGEQLVCSPIGELFDHLDRSLLILDGVGSGKTTTLLELARDNLNRAESDPLQPIPVVLNLSSWGQAEQSIADWVVEELNGKYSIPIHMGREWLAKDELALLLDGLDEVRPELRKDCIVALNKFRQEHGLIPLAVCSRSEEYQAAGLPLRLGGAVKLQPLTPEQVEAYLQSVRPPPAALNQALKEDAELQTLASSPLVLNLMRQAFGGLAVEALQEEAFDTPEERRLHLVNAFVERIFAPPDGSAIPYPRSQAETWLGWIARRLAEENLSMFLIERLQPGWLSKAAQRWAYWLISRGLAGLIFGIVLAVTAQLGRGVMGGLGYILSATLSGLLVGLIDGVIAERLPAASRERPPRGGLATAGRVLACGLAAFAVYWLIFYFWVDLGADSLRNAAGASLVFGLLFGLQGSQRSPEADIQPAEALAWSWAEARKSLPVGLLFLFTSIATTAVLFARSNPVKIWLLFGLMYGLITFLALFLIFGLRGKTIEARSFPNQGIYLSGRNAIRGGLLLGVISGLLYGLVYGPLPGLLLGLRLGVLAAFWYGGFDLIKHAVLRLLLFLDSRTPLQLVHFLNWAAGVQFLHRVGGGYVFANRLIQGYFTGKTSS